MLTSSLHHIMGHTIIVRVLTNDWPFISYHVCCSVLSFLSPSSTSTSTAITGCTTAPTPSPPRS